LGFLAALALSSSAVRSDVTPASAFEGTDLVGPSPTADAGTESRLFFLVAIAVCVVVLGGVVAFGAVVLRRRGCHHPSSDTSFSDVADEPGGPASQAEQPQVGTSIAQEDPPPGSIFLRLV
jgi:hypothetical protein